MTTVTQPPAVAAPSRGRLYLWAGLLLFVLSLVLPAVQFFALKQLVVPWYLPVLTTLGVLLIILSLVQRRTIVRLLALGLLTLVAVFQWTFLVSLAKLPAYDGPAQVGQKVPGFRTAKADGQPFTEADLHKGTPTVITFYRGRW